MLMPPLNQSRLTPPLAPVEPPARPSRQSGTVRNTASTLLLLLLALCASPSSQAQTGHGISAANIKVIQNDTSNTVDSVTVTTTLSVNDFRIRPGSNRGDYNVQIGLGFSDDSDSGVLISSVAENGR